MIHSRLLAIGICLLLQHANAQVGIGVSTPNALAQLHVQSTSKGMLVPRMTLSERNSIIITSAAGANGLLVYQTDGTPGFYYYNGSSWVLITNNLVVKNAGTNFTNSLLIGHDTTGTLSSAQRNLGVGSSTLRSLTNGDDNTAIGFMALNSNTTGIENIAIGPYSLRLNTSGQNNMALGIKALYSNTTGIYNTALGSYALEKSTTSTENIAIGPYSLNNNTTGSSNTAMGISALSSSTTGDENVAIGPQTLSSNTIGKHNVALGSIALPYSTTGNKNIALGRLAGENIATGNNNIVIGDSAMASSATVSNEVTIGTSRHDSYRIFASGWTNASDASYKHDISDLPAGLDFVKRLRPVEFVYNHSSKEEKSYGFIAQEVKDAVEEQGLVRSGLVQNMDASHLGLKTTELIPVLTKAIQEQQRQIEEQKREIENLKRMMGKRRGRRAK